MVPEIGHLGLLTADLLQRKHTAALHEAGHLPAVMLKPDRVQPVRAQQRTATPRADSSRADSQSAPASDNIVHHNMRQRPAATIRPRRIHLAAWALALRNGLIQDIEAAPALRKVNRSQPRRNRHRIA